MASNEKATSSGSELTKLKRFLCYGSETGTYFSTPPYAQSPQPNLESAQCILHLIDEGKGEEVIDEICSFAKDNVAVRSETVVFALAVCAKLSKDLKTKQAALKAVTKVCSSATDIFKFAEYSEKLSGKTTGWGRGQRKAVSEWYLKKESGALATAVTKFIQRSGWSHLDLIRLSHVKPEKDATAVCLKYVVKGLDAAQKQYGSDCPSAEVTSILAYLEAVDRVKHSTCDSDIHSISRLIEQHQLSREHVPTTIINDKEVWRALLQHMSINDILDNLNRITSLGLLEDGEKQNQAHFVTDRFKNDTLIKESRIQPFRALLALKTYEQGKVEKGKLKWIPNSGVIDGLNSMFLSSFKNVEVTNKRYLIAVNVNSLSKGPVLGSNILPPILTASSVVMTLCRSETSHQPEVLVCTEAGEATPVNITPQMSLNEVTQAFSKVSGERSRDNSMAITWAMENKKPVDVFLVLSDNASSMTETIDPAQILTTYRQELNIPHARAIFVSLTNCGLCFGDNDGIMNVIGFDAATPKVIRNFVTGKV